MLYLLFCVELNLENLSGGMSVLDRIGGLPDGE